MDHNSRKKCIIPQFIRKEANSPTKTLTRLKNLVIIWLLKKNSMPQQSIESKNSCENKEKKRNELKKKRKRNDLNLSNYDKNN
jgi:hypothetical protein